MITVTPHEKTEWARFATASYAIGRNDLGHTYSVAASIPAGERMDAPRFYALQRPYHAWLARNEYLAAPELV